MYEKGIKLHGRIGAFKRPSGSTIESQRLIILRNVFFSFCKFPRLRLFDSLRFFDRVEKSMTFILF